MKSISFISSHLTCFFTCCLAFCLGCQPEPADFHITAQVSGSISLDGTPIANAKIVFLPEKLLDLSNEVTPLAYGLTDDTGEFQLKSGAGQSEILAGEYRVIISKRSKKSLRGKRFSDFDRKFEFILPAEFRQFRRHIVRDEVLPMLYNVDTILTYQIPNDSNVAVANFDLTTVDPLLIN